MGKPIFPGIADVSHTIMSGNGKAGVPPFLRGGGLSRSSKILVPISLTVVTVAGKTGKGDATKIRCRLTHWDAHSTQ